MSDDGNEFHRCVDEWQQPKDADRLAMTEYLHQGFECQESNPEQSLALFTRGRDQAQRLNEPWWILFYESWRLTALTSFLEDFARAQPLAMELMIRFNSPPGLNHSQRASVLVNVLETYSSIDPFGYRDELEKGFAYQDERISRGPAPDRFVLNYRRRSYLCSTGRWNEAYDLAMQSLALVDQSTNAEIWNCSWVLYQLCQICHVLGRVDELAGHAARMSELSAKNGQLRRTEADGWIWHAFARRTGGDERDASRSFRRGMRVLGKVEHRDYICANSTAAYYELSGDLKAALGVRDRELAEVTRKGMFHRICEVQLERCRLLTQSSRLAFADLGVARKSADQLRSPDWYLEKLDRFKELAR